MEESSSSITNAERENDGPINLPDELMRFIERDTYSLLIKGFAGTGKTTLALTILKTLGSRNNFFYISTRISPKQLFQYYPWLSKFIELPKPSNSGEGQEHNLTPSFEDARLDEPESLFERITNQLMDIASPIIIIDSWDAIASFMDKEARLNNERVLQTWRERAGAKLIFISEHPDDTTLDFLVDGIVELKQSYMESMRVREILLLKLRGVRIERSS
ncbi:MAG TPA: gas vesicle protein GvpD P-loop domain-containing protein, partial [Nitrososphaera sp.]